ncbi:winged helix-turn-helix domain-containing protein [Aureisphaera galaxeae]|uniref:winged helix-turn-helix domain-containing protein n=1 Tax=Aureisphaera galaxeae TaxID=1538023 RepID=UPI002350FE9D|nr:winged helix-turn-helix domain-containing protein [Aureisphaera galaxeae]MDC8006172.1 winged helix-turn-helix domain-containing protein [Aureisphaera galaxeae]
MKLTESIEIRESSNELVLKTKHGERLVKLENQIMKILQLLAEKEGIIVSKEQFIEEIWSGNSYTGEQALTRNIYKLREIFKQNGIHEVIAIETIPKKGYRLVLSSSEKKENKENRNKLLLWYAALLVLILPIILVPIVQKHKNSESPELLRYDTSKDTVIFLEGSEELKVYEIDTINDTLVELKK